MVSKTNSYQWDAKEYAANASAQRAWAAELIEKLALGSEERVLDIGCGDGRISADIATLVPGGGCVGIDSSAAMIALAATTYPPADHPNLTFRNLDARRLDFDSTFDVVFSNAALHWVRDHRPVLRGIAACLKPGGRLLLQMGGAGNVAGFLEAVEQVLRSDPWPRYFSGFEMPYGFHGPKDYTRWLQQVGLEPQRVELIGKDMVHPSAEGLKGWMRTTWLPYLEQIPQALREAFIGLVVGRYLEAHPQDAQGRTHVAMVRLEVAAFKPAGAGSP